MLSFFAQPTPSVTFCRASGNNVHTDVSENLSFLNMRVLLLMAFHEANPVFGFDIGRWLKPQILHDGDGCLVDGINQGVGFSHSL